MRLWIDIETFSKINLKKVGAYRYAEDETTRVLLVGYAIDNDPARVWDVTATDECPEDLRQALENPDVVLVAHNSMFDRNVLSRKLEEFKPFADPKRWRDSMVQAYSMGLPGKLEQLSVILGLPEDKAKDHDGRRLILKFSKPGLRGKIRDRTTDPEDWVRYVNYCRKDVEAMRDTAKRIPLWNVQAGHVWDDWHIDQIINDRGVPIDRGTVLNAIKTADELKVIANEELSAKTLGRLYSTGQSAKLLKYIEDEYGIALEKCTKSNLQEALRRADMPDEVKELIELRLGAAVVSVQKYKKMDEMLCADGTTKGTLQFMGASRTGRWAGRGLQMQNIARGMFKSPEETEQAIRAINAGLVPLLYEDPNRVLSSCIRGVIKAPPGEKFVVADLSNIEGRMLAWLAGETWKIHAFNLYDQGKGPDLYKATYAKAFATTPDKVTKDQRQIGKVMELALGYQGGVSAFVTFATLGGLDLDALAVLTHKSVSAKDWGDSLNSYDWALEKGLTCGLSRDAYVACNTLKNIWRRAHPRVTAFWERIETACRNALFYDEVETVGRLKVGLLRKGWLGVKLPSGRYVVYPGARLPKAHEQCAMVYQGIPQQSSKWSEIMTYGGKLTENIVQAIARDVLMCGIRNAEARGFKIRFHVHDEIVATVPKDSPLGVEDMAACMTTGMPWAEGLPLAAAGFEAERYRKD